MILLEILLEMNMHSTSARTSTASMYGMTPSVIRRTEACVTESLTTEPSDILTAEYSVSRESVSDSLLS